MIQKVHHVAIAVRDLKGCLSLYADLFGLETRVQELEQYSVKLAFIPVGDVLVEFLQPTSDGDPFGISRFLDENGEGFHHIAYEVEDIHKTLELLKEKGIRLMNDEPKAGADGLIAFAHKDSMGGVLVEFIETPKE